MHVDVSYVVGGFNVFAILSMANMVVLNAEPVDCMSLIRNGKGEQHGNVGQGEDACSIQYDIIELFVFELLRIITNPNASK